MNDNKNIDKFDSIVEGFDEENNKEDNEEYYYDDEDYEYYNDYY